MSRKEIDRRPLVVGGKRVTLAELRASLPPEVVAANAVRRGRQQRLRSYINRNFGVGVFIEAQNGLCPLCSKPMRGHKATIEHVRGRHLQGNDGSLGNIVVAHKRCNERKGGADPYPCEILWLEIVNEKLGWDGKMYWNTPRGRELKEHEERVRQHNPNFQLKARTYVF